MNRLQLSALCLLSLLGLCFGIGTQVDYVGGDITQTSASSAVGCASACDNTNGCVAWAWDSCGGNSCWLKSSVNGRSPNSCRLSGVKLGDNGVDRSGGDMAGMPLNLGSATSSACADRCESTPGCVAWSFDSCGKSSCWLKSSIPTNTNANSCRVSGVQGTIGIDRPGNDLASMVLPNGATATQCSQACLNQPGCNGWAFVNPGPGCETSNNCWLKSSGAGGSYNSGCRISGSIGSSGSSGSSSGSSSSGSCSSSYTVVSGDTCSAISSKTGVSTSTIISLNPSVNSGCTNLAIGQVLCLAKSSGSSSGGCTGTYTVASGDTCYAISQRFGTSVANIIALNPSVNSGCTNLAVGQVLCISGSSGSSSSSGSVSSGSSSSGTSSGSTSGSGSWPNGPLKAIYIDSGINWANPGSTFQAIADAGYNLIILAFSVAGQPADAVSAWNSVSDKSGVVSYIHARGAKIIVSGGGATDTPYGQMSGTAYGTNLANYARSNGLDGVDFDLENFGSGFTSAAGGTSQTVQWVIDATNAARNILGASGIITHAPQPPYFGANAGFADGYGKIYRGAPSINFLMVQYYNNGPASSYSSLFTSSNGGSINEIAQSGIPLSKLVVGKPVLSSDAGSEWVPASTLKSIFSQAKSSLGWNTGVMGWQWHDVATNQAWLQGIFN